MRSTGALTAIDQYFFARTSVVPLALFRILFGILVLAQAVLLLPEISVWLQPDSAVTVDSAQSVFNVPSFSFWHFFPESRSLAWIVLASQALAAVCLIVGIRSRIALVVIYLCLLSTYHRNPLIFHSGDIYMRMQALWLIFSPCGEALSIDHQRKEKSKGAFGALAPSWSLRIAQWQFCFVYISAFFSKIQSNHWLDGTALYYATHLQMFARLPLPLIFENIVLCKILTWTSLSIELALFTLIWFRPLRYPLLIVALLFHLLIEWSMNIPLFEWLMISSLVLFIDVRDIDHFLNRKTRQHRSPDELLPESST